MQKGIIVAVIVILSATAFAQENEKVRVKEVGLTFYNFDGFGITYRVGKENALWRFNTGFGNGIQEYAGDNVRSNFSIGTNVGREWRKEVTSKLDFRYGVDLQYSFATNSNENSNLTNVSENKNVLHFGGINVVLGFNYEISKSVFIGAELLPFFGINYSESESYSEFADQFGIVNITQSESSTYSNRFGIQNNSALLSVAYRF